MLTARLPPGTVLQFWDDSPAYDLLRARDAAGGEPAGHSPIFLRYDGPANAPTGIWVLDQTGKTGETRCPVTGVAPRRRLHWHGYEPDLWIAASWTE
jgi:hypothetical protein